MGTGKIAAVMSLATLASMYAPQMTQGATLALYDFGTPEAPDLNSAGSYAGVFNAALGLGSHSSGWPTNYPSNANGIYADTEAGTTIFAQKPMADVKTQTDAQDLDAYWSFTVTPQIAEALSLDELSFDLTLKNKGRPVSYYLSTSINGFNTPVSDPVEASKTSGPVVFDLSSAEYQNIAAPVEFRLYLWSTVDGGSSGSRWEFDNIALTGAVVPEPAALSILGIGGLFALTRRRRS